MFSGFKDWLLGRTPDYQSVGSKMAGQFYYVESKSTNRTAIVKMPGLDFYEFNNRD